MTASQRVRVRVALLALLEHLEAATKMIQERAKHAKPTPKSGPKRPRNQLCGEGPLGGVTGEQEAWCCFCTLEAQHGATGMGSAGTESTGGTNPLCAAVVDGGCYAAWVYP